MPILLSKPYQLLTDTQNTCSLYGVEAVADEGSSIFYRLTIVESGNVIIHTLGSALQGTEISVRQASDIVERTLPAFLYTSFLEKHHLWNDSLYSADQDCYVLHNLPSGTYLVSVKGKGSLGSDIVNGEISTTFIAYPSGYFDSLLPAPFYLEGMPANPVYLGGSDETFSFNGEFATPFYHNFQGGAGQDIYFEINIEEKSYVTVSPSDSIRLYLSKAGAATASMQVVSDSITMMLQRGKYQIIAEPLSPSIPLSIHVGGVKIHAYSNEEATYEEMLTDPDLPVSFSTIVGSPGGDFSVGELGNAAYFVSLDVPQGVGGMQPNIGIDYSSHAGFGLAGYGSQLTGLSMISRTGSDIYHDGEVKGLTHTMTDNFLLDGKRLLLISGTTGQEGAVYELEGDPFTRITLRGNYETACWFEVKTQDGKTYEYGHATGKQLYTRSNGGQSINAWYIDRTEDALGNYMVYEYEQDDLFLYPKVIHYGKNTNQPTSLDNTIEFTYQLLSGAEKRLFRIENAEGKLKKMLTAIISKTNGTVFRKYLLNYSFPSQMITFPLLTSITEQNQQGENLRPIQFGWDLAKNERQDKKIYISLEDGRGSFETLDRLFCSSDVNSDGLPDIIRLSNVDQVTNYPDGGWNRRKFGYVYLYLSTMSDGKVSYQSPKTYNIGADVSFDFVYSAKNNIITADFTSDGYTDLLIPHLVCSDGMANSHLSLICGRDIAKGQGDVAEQIHDIDGTNAPLYISSDFDGDGKEELLYLNVNKNKTSQKFQGAIGRLTGDKEFSFSQYEISLSLPPKHLFIGDFNSDGLIDIFIQHTTGYTILYNNGTSSVFTDASKLYVSGLPVIDYIDQGDFNGDGLVDFIYNTKTDNKYYFLFNQGDGSFTSQLAYTLPVLTSVPEQDKHTMLVADFNHDGRSDVIIAKANNFYDNGTLYQCGIRWLQSTGEGLTLFHNVNTHRADDAAWYNLLVGDFMGNGDACVMNYGSNIYAQSNNTNEIAALHLYYTPNYTCNTGKITCITDGWGRTTDITYGTTADDTAYTKNAATISSATFPQCLYGGAVPVVKSTTQSNGAAGNVTQQYHYEDLLLHRQGRGLLGFNKTTVTNATLGSATEQTILQRDKVFFQPLSVQTKTAIGSESTQQTVTYSLTQKGQHNFVLYPTQETSVGIHGETTVTERTYNTTLGIPLTETSRNSAGDMYRTTAYVAYTHKAGQHLPQHIVTTQKHRDSSESYSTQTHITYNDRGLPVTTLQFIETPQPTTTKRTFDAFGNVLTETTSSSAGTDQTRENVYDPTGRFVVRSGYTSVPYTTYTHDLWGNVLTETAVKGGTANLTTTYTYNAWGQRTGKQTPDGQTTTYLIGRQTDADGYFTLESPANAAWTKTTYDSQGRELKTETLGPRGLEISSETTYNVQGLPITKTQTTGHLTLIQQTTYDAWGRKTSERSSTGSETQYANSAYEVETTQNGRTYTVTTDEWGNTIESTDPVSSVQYAYHSNGKPSTVSSEGSTVTMNYDAAGHRTEIVDPDAGTIQSVYLPDGRISEHTDARGVTTRYAYDQQKRPTQIIIGTDTITYTYGISGNDAQLLVHEQMGNKSIHYTHDALGRLINETRTLGNEQCTYTYEYNAKNQLSKTIYPGNLVVTYEYDPYGNPLKTFVGDSLVWHLAVTDGRDQTQTLGSHLRQITRRNQQGYLVEQTIQSSHSAPDGGVSRAFLYTHDAPTGNLLSRTGMLPSGATETFAYDNLDRLTVITVDNETQQTVSYAANGNITTKTGLGNLYYESTRPHAVTEMTNSDAVIPSTTQETTYNALNKIESIEDAGTDYALRFHYGPDQERWQTELFHGDTLKRTMRYLGDVEIREEDGIQTWYYYIGNALVVRQLNLNTQATTTSIYQLFTDNLGSVTTIFDSNGDTVFEASYDAWGNQTTKKNDIGFHRGYTGHEMLPEFGLINMNGRLYDPVLGQFLSPDNYVQDPTNSQNFNRYAYCLNNPLKYTDPSGEFWHLIIGAAIGGLFNWASHGFQFNAKGLGYFATGALAGAISAGIGSGVNVAMANGNFWAGFAGAAKGVSSTGFIAGGAAGASAGFAGGFITGAGNAWVGGSNFGKGLLSGFKAGGIGTLTGGVAGGISGGIDALSKGVDFWDGTIKVPLNGAYSCMHCDPQDIINKLKEYCEKIRVKYVGEFRDAHVFETKVLGDINDAYSAFTIPERGIVAAKGVYTSNLDRGTVMLQHEYGHILQYRKVGPTIYYKVIAKESILNCGFDRITKLETHSTYWTETWANYLAKNLFGKNWLGREDLSKGTSMYYPSKNTTLLEIIAHIGLSVLFF